MRLRLIYLVLILVIGCSSEDNPNTSSQDSANNIEQPVTNSQADQAYPNQDRRVSYDSGGGSVLSYFFLGAGVLLVGGGILWLFKKTEELNSKIDRLRSDMREFNHKMEGPYGLREKLNKIDSSLDKLEQNVNAKLASYKSYIDKSVDEISNDTKSTKQNTSSENRNTASRNQGIQGIDYSVLKKADSPKRTRKEKNKSQAAPIDRNTKTLFFSGPEKSGKFNHDKGDTEPSEKKIYSISYHPSESTGQLEYLSSNYDGQVINHKDSMLRPVCDIIESDEGSYTKVKMKNPGKVKREGGYWVVEEKIKIEIL